MRHPSPAAAAALLALALLLPGCSPRLGTGTVPAASAAAAGLADADSLHSAAVAPGVTHVRAWLRQGPWAVHVVEVDPARCTARWEVRAPEGTLDARALTSTLAADAIAGINADFFQIPGGTPVGAEVRDRVPHIGPAGRAAWLWDGRTHYAGLAELHGTVSAGDDGVPLVQVNRSLVTTSAFAPPAHGAALFTARAARVPPPAGATLVWLRLERGDERAGRARIERVAPAGTDTAAVPAGAALLQLMGDARAWAERRRVGEVVAWQAAVRPEGQAWDAHEAVGGFPVLLRDGADVLAETPRVGASFGAQRHPRSALGWSRASGRFFLVLVDGRQAPYSDGMSLPELTWLFQRLGASDAINLDGGGSSALVVRGGVVNRPSDRQGERQVGNALALAGCR